MKLRNAIKGLKVLKTHGDADTEISGICTDSRRVKEGDLFICYEGEKEDSHEYAAEACARGAAAIVCSRELGLDVPQAIVSDGRAAIAVIARNFYNFPDKKLKIIGITGTNGKTTTSYMLKSIFEADGNSCAVIGTLGIAYANKFVSPELTTPDPVFLFCLLDNMVKCGVNYVFMEVSAHALYFGKVDGIYFDATIFTNLTQDHLDFFGDMKSYGESKKLLFSADRSRLVIINSDDEFGAELTKYRQDALTYGLENPADTFAIDLSEDVDGTSFVINISDELYDIRLNMPAIHNVYNALAAATCAHALGVSTEAIAEGLAVLKGVNGRLECVAVFRGARIFVDFAHTPDGLEKSLSCLKKLCDNRLYCLFGCGGNRDVTKRPIMGEIAGKYADFLIITSDNPRFEDPYDIISGIEEGVKRTNVAYVTISDREMATEYAVNLLKEGDILLVAGKGGETYQEIMGIKHSYNDNTVIKKIIGNII